MPTLAAALLQQWALILSTYQNSIEYRTTQEPSNADCLSRLPLESEEVVNYVTDPGTDVNRSQIDFLPVDSQKLRMATSTDPVLSKVLTYVQDGWLQAVDP